MNRMFWLCPVWWMLLVQTAANNNNGGRSVRQRVAYRRRNANNDGKHEPEKGDREHDNWMQPCHGGGGYDYYASAADEHDDVDFDCSDTSQGNDASPDAAAAAGSGPYGYYDYAAGIGEDPYVGGPVVGDPFVGRSFGAYGPIEERGGFGKNFDDERTETQRPPRTEERERGPRNFVNTTVFFALAPQTPSFKRVLTRVVTAEFNETVDAYHFYPTRFLFGGGNNRLLQEESLQKHLPEWDMFYEDTDSDIVQKDEDKWWWRYDFQYRCFWRDDHSAVNNQTFLLNVSNKLTHVLELRIEDGELQENFMAQVGNLVLDVALSEEEFQPTRDDRHNVTIVRISPRDEEYLEPLDAQEWDYRRYLGLALFCATALVTLVLTNLAYYRKRRRKATEVWGNLGSEQGVNELLKTGWVLKESHMLVYDKAKLGYNDDDSLFMGGFEQREVVGAEITVTHPESESRTFTTPDIRTQDGLSLATPDTRTQDDRRSDT